MSTIKVYVIVKKYFLVQLRHCKSCITLQVGPTYGRRTMKGYLESTLGGHSASQTRIGQSMARVAPGHHGMRLNRTASMHNPQTYVADYFGHKLHVDQNEKLAMYGMSQTVLNLDTSYLIHMCT